MMNDAGRDFFSNLFDRSVALIARFPLTREPPVMAFITDRLEPIAGELRDSHPFVDPDPAAAAGRRAAVDPRDEALEFGASRRRPRQGARAA